MIALDDPRSFLTWTVVLTVAALCILGVSLIALDWVHAVYLRIRDWGNDTPFRLRDWLMRNKRPELVPGTVIPLHKARPVPEWNLVMSDLGERRRWARHG